MALLFRPIRHPLFASFPLNSPQFGRGADACSSTSHDDYLALTVRSSLSSSHLAVKIGRVATFSLAVREVRALPSTA
jgi:hypothetical protein